MGWHISAALMKDYENSHCSQAQEAEYSEATCSDGEQSAQLSESPTPQAYLCSDRMTAFSRLSRYGMTFAHLTEDRGADLLTWFLEGFRARTLAQQEKVLELTEIVPDSGERWHELSVRYDLDSSSWKTVNCLFPEDLHWSSVTLPKSGMCAGGFLYQQENWERLTTDQDYGCLPTPSGVNGGRNNTMGRLDEWGGSSNPLRGTEIGKVRCANFEEWMMGWPTGWSALTPLGMDKFLAWQQQHSAF